MAWIPTVLIAFVGAGAFYTLIGHALVRRIRPSWSPAAGVAPALGWAIFSAISFPLQNYGGFSRASTVILAGLALVGAVLALARFRGLDDAAETRMPVWAFVIAGLIALIPLAGLLPKLADGGVIIGPTAFDHSKIAMVDEMTRLGLPVGNPFFGLSGARSTLSYYYLWHFSAAQLSIVGGVSGWEADAAMTGFTAYASLVLMMGLASRFCGRWSQSEGRKGRSTAAVVWVGLLSLAGSLRPLMTLLFGHHLDGLLTNYYSLEGWMDQASWVPQHLASGCCVVLAVLLLADLSQRRGIPRLLILGAVAAAGFGSSTWVGGVTFALAGGAVGMVLTMQAKASQRLWFVAGVVAAGIVAAGLAFPFLHAEFGSVAARGGAAPIAFHPYEVIGDWAPHALRRVLDLPAFWFILLPLDMPAIYPMGVIALALYLRQSFKARRSDPDAPKPPAPDPHALALAVLAFGSLCVAWLLASTLGNNDLGWRAVIPAVLVLTPFAAAGLAHWTGARIYAAAVPAIALFAAATPDRMAFANIEGRSTENAPDFAAAPALWSAVRRYAGPADRVANNPQFLDDLTDWPVNPGWAMLSNRASCYSGWETARAYVDLPLPRLTEIDKQFTRVFDGLGSPDDVRQMAQDYGCRVVALIESDGAWTKDPFAHSPYYRLAEEKSDQWRIYLLAESPAIKQRPATPLNTSGRRPSG